jgi:hypothetical protein
MDCGPENEYETMAGLGIVNLSHRFSRGRSTVRPVSSVPEMEVDEMSPTQEPSFTPRTPASLSNRIQRTSKDRRQQFADPIDGHAMEITRDIHLLNQLFDPNRRASILDQIQAPEIDHRAQCSTTDNPFSLSCGYGAPITPHTDWFDSPLLDLPPGTAKEQAQMLHEFKASFQTSQPKSQEQMREEFRRKYQYQSIMNWGEMMRQRDLKEERELQQQVARQRSRDTRTKKNFNEARQSLGRGIFKSIMKRW